MFFGWVFNIPDFVRLTTRTPHVGASYVRRAKLKRVDHHRGGIERLTTRTAPCSVQRRGQAYRMAQCERGVYHATRVAVNRMMFVFVLLHTGRGQRDFFWLLWLLFLRGTIESLASTCGI